MVDQIFVEWIYHTDEREGSEEELWMTPILRTSSIYNLFNTAFTQKGRKGFYKLYGPK